MHYDAKKTLDEFNKQMLDIKRSIPTEYEAFINEKLTITKEGKLPEKNKWLLVLISSVATKCPVCITKGVQHCLDAGWTKEEILEACMIPVLIGGSSVMTYVTLVDKAINELQK